MSRGFKANYGNAAMAEARSLLCGGATEAAQTSRQRPRSLFNETSQGPCECTQRGTALFDGQCHRGHANYVFSKSPLTPLSLLHLYTVSHTSFSQPRHIITGTRYDY